MYVGGFNFKFLGFIHKVQKQSFPFIYKINHLRRRFSESNEFYPLLAYGILEEVKAEKR